MAEIIRDIEQGSEEWFALRLGSVGGSSVNAVLAKGQGKMRKALLYRLAGEILSGVPAESPNIKYAERGHLYEPEARDCYGFLTGAEVEQCALIQLRTGVHYSPDGLVGDDGLIEIKVNLPHVWVETRDAGVPLNYRRQMQHGLYVSGRQWCDFCAYCPEMKDPLWVTRFERDEKIIAQIEKELPAFLKDLESLVKKIRGEN